MKIQMIKVLTGRGEDKIVLYLDLPTPYPNMGYVCSATVGAQSEYGEEWAKVNFPGIPIEVIHM